MTHWRFHLRTAVGLGILLAALATETSAQELPPTGAVGQVKVLGKPGRGLCTGTLVAPAVMLTARHCVAGDGPDGIVQPARIVFIPGWDGKVNATAHLGTDVEPARQIAQKWDGDAVLVTLADAPATAPLPLGAPPELGTEIAVASYANARPDRVHHDTCTVMQRAGALIGLDCAVQGGMSGAPLLLKRDGGWEVTGVLVARVDSSGPVRSLALAPDFATRDDPVR